MKIKFFIFLICLFSVISVLLYAPKIFVKNSVLNKAIPCCLNKNTLEIGYAKKNSKEFFNVLDISTYKVLKIPCKEFLTSTVALEMDAESYPEALKAQAIASNTFFRNLAEKEKINLKKDLNGADFTVNSKEKVYYLTKEQLKEKWGKKYEENYRKIYLIVSNVYSEVLKFNGKYIEALYYNISSGTTENNLDVFGNYTPYLTSVSSQYDLLSPNYLNKKTLSVNEFRNIVVNKYSDVNFLNNNPIKMVEIANTGFVKKVKIYNKLLTGRDVRALFALKSANFKVDVTKSNIIFTTKGHGHGVGMSQFGANQMAINGKTYKDILKHYYPGTVLCRENY